MPTIKKATIKSYSATTHKATVQIAGSLGVWLDAVRVATDIPAADVVAGRQCTVLFLDPANQDDAVVLTIQGALPSGGGGGTTDHAVLTNLAYATAAHTGFGGTAVVNTWAALQTFSAGLILAAAQTIQDSGGAARILLATTLPEVTLTGSVRINSNVGIDSPPVTTPDQKLTISPTVAGVTDWRGLTINPALTLTGNNRAATGIFGSAGVVIPASSSGHSIYGLSFVAFASPDGAAAAATLLTGAHAAPQIVAIGSGKALTVTEFNALSGDPTGLTVILATCTITTLRAAKLKGATINNANLTITTVEALRIEDWAGSSVGTCRLVEVGPATPYFRIVGKAAPGANLTNVYINENGTLRQVQWKAGNALVAADKVMVLV